MVHQNRKKTFCVLYTHIPHSYPLLGTFGNLAQGWEVLKS